MPYDSTVALLRIFPSEVKRYFYIDFMWIFISALITIDKNPKHKDAVLTAQQGKGSILSSSCSPSDGWAALIPWCLRTLTPGALCLETDQVYLGWYHNVAGTGGGFASS